MFCKAHRARFNAKLLGPIDTLVALVLFVLWKNIMIDHVNQTAYYCGCVFGVIAMLGDILNIVLVLSDPDSYNV